MRGGQRSAPASGGSTDWLDDDHRPALDGLRAVAVAGVVLFHLDRLPGGYLGVDAFFVVSGWLITYRLLTEARRSPRGAIHIGRFWEARVRRLLPASLLVILTIALLWTALDINVPSLRRDLLWAIGWSSNWGTINGGGDYWARFGEPSPVTHFWSLAIEEQFYLAWPLIVALVLRLAGARRDIALAAVSGALALASVAFMAASFDPARPTATYMHTFARAHTILIGATAAALTAILRPRLSGTSLARWAPRIAVIMALTLAGAASADSDWLYSWGFPAFALAMVVVVVAAAHARRGSLLTARPLRWVGERSYGIYLWHWPVILVLSADRAPVGGLALDLVRVALTLTLAAVSYRWLEMPIRRPRLPRRPGATVRTPVAVFGAVAACLVLVVTQVPDRRGASAEPVVSVRVLPPTPTTAVPIAYASLSSLPTAAPERTVVLGVTVSPSAPIRVLVAGDSTAVHLADALLSYADEHSDQIVAGSAAFPGCGLTAAGDGRRHEFSNRDGTRGLVDLSGCTVQWRSIVDRVSSDELIDVVLVQLGAWDAEDIHLADGRVVSVVDDVGGREVKTAYERFVSEVEGAGARIVWVRPPDTHLGWGAIDAPVNDPRRWTSMRRILDDLPVEQIDLPTWLLARDLDGPDARPDGVHLTDEVLSRFIQERVVPRLVALGPADSPPATRGTPAPQSP